jgi:signal transduction histidine kinase
MGGRVEVASAPGGPTQFTVRLPSAPAPASPREPVAV